MNHGGTQRYAEETEGTEKPVSFHPSHFGITEVVAFLHVPLRPSVVNFLAISKARADASLLQLAKNVTGQLSDPYGLHPT